MIIKKLKEIRQKYKEKRYSRKRVKEIFSEGLQLPHKINNVGNDIAIVGIFKNESPYIAEWIKFHRMVGFTRFILYDNGSDDRSADIARENSLGDDVTVIDWEHFNVRYGTQFLAYSHAAANFGDQCKWMCFIDIDEFLFPIEHLPIGEILERYKEIPSIAIPWHMYGTSGHKTPPDGGVIANFRQRVSFPPAGKDIKILYKYKSIFQPRYLVSCHLHLPLMSLYPDHFFNENKEKIPVKSRFDTRFACSDIFRLNHYYTRDMETLEKKLKSGRANSLEPKSGSTTFVKRAAITVDGDIIDPIAIEKSKYYSIDR